MDSNTSIRNKLNALSWLAGVVLIASISFNMYTYSNASLERIADAPVEVKTKSGVRYLSAEKGRLYGFGAGLALVSFALVFGSRFVIRRMDKKTTVN